MVMIQKSVESKIKLYYAGTLQDGTIRLQSQLYVGKDSADFIIKNGSLHVWDCSNGGFGFHETNIPHEIIYFKKEMQTQIL